MPVFTPYNCRILKMSCPLSLTGAVASGAKAYIIESLFGLCDSPRE